MRFAEGGRDEQSLVECSEVESPIEAVCKRSEISGRILLEIERMVAAAQAGLEIAQHGVDPLKFGLR